MADEAIIHKRQGGGIRIHGSVDSRD